MSTKQSLLQESRKVLQEQLGTALLEDYSKEKLKSAVGCVSKEKDLVPIITTTGSNDRNAQPAEDRHNNAKEEKETIKLIQCQGWIRESRIWIQAQALVL